MTLCMCTGGIQVTPADAGVPFAHGVLLSAAVADTPAAQKLTKVFAHSAKLGCGYCTLHGQHPANSSHGMYFLGYKQPTTASTPPLIYTHCTLMHAMNIAHLCAHVHVHT